MSDKYIFKKKLSLRRKSKRRLFIESFFMLITSLLIVYINYLIPNKGELVQNLPTSLNKFYVLFFDLVYSLYDVLLIIFIFISLTISLILFLGSIYRLFRIINRKTKKYSS